MMDENEGSQPTRRRSMKRASGGILKIADREPLSQIMDMTLAGVEEEEPTATMTFAKRPKRNKKRVSFHGTKTVKTFCKDDNYVDSNQKSILSDTNSHEHMVNVTKLSDDGSLNRSGDGGNMSINDGDLTINIQKYFTSNFCPAESNDVTLNMGASNYGNYQPSPKIDKANRTIKFGDDMNTGADTSIFNLTKPTPYEGVNEDNATSENEKTRFTQEELMAKLCGTDSNQMNQPSSSTQISKEDKSKLTQEDWMEKLLATDTGKISQPPKSTKMDFILEDAEITKDNSIFSATKLLRFDENLPSENVEIEDDKSSFQVNLNDLTTTSDVSMNITDVNQHTEMIMKQLNNSNISIKDQSITNLQSINPVDLSNFSKETPTSKHAIDTISHEESINDGNFNSASKEPVILKHTMNATSDHEPINFGSSNNTAFAKHPSKEKEASMQVTNSFGNLSTINQLTMKTLTPDKSMNSFGSLSSALLENPVQNPVVSSFGIFSATLSRQQTTTSNSISTTTPNKATNTFSNLQSTLPGCSAPLHPIDSNFRDRKMDTSDCEVTPNQSLSTTPQQQADGSPGEMGSSNGGDTPSFIEIFNNKISLMKQGDVETVDDSKSPAKKTRDALPLLHTVTPNRPAKPIATCVTPLGVTCLDETKIPDFDPSKTFTDVPRSSAFTPVRVNKTLPIPGMVTKSSSKANANVLGVAISRESGGVGSKSTDKLESKPVEELATLIREDSFYSQPEIITKENKDRNKTDGLKEMSSFLKRFTNTRQEEVPASIQDPDQTGVDQNGTSNSSHVDFSHVRMKIQSPVRKIMKESDDMELASSPNYMPSVQNTTRNLGTTSPIFTESTNAPKQMESVSQTQKNQLEMSAPVSYVPLSNDSRVSNETLKISVPVSSEEQNKSHSKPKEQHEAERSIVEKEQLRDRRQTYTLEDRNKESMSSAPEPIANVVMKDKTNDRRRTFTVDNNINQQTATSVEDVNNQETTTAVPTTGMKLNVNDKNDRRKTFTINSNTRRETYTLEDIHGQGLIPVPESQPILNLNKNKDNDRRRTFTIKSASIIGENSKPDADGQWLDESNLGESLHFRPPMANSTVMVSKGDYGLLTDDETTAVISRIEDRNQTVILERVEESSNDNKIADVIDKTSADPEISVSRHHGVKDLHGKTITEAEKSMLRDLKEVKVNHGLEEHVGKAIADAEKSMVGDFKDVKKDHVAMDVVSKAIADAEKSMLKHLKDEEESKEKNVQEIDINTTHTIENQHDMEDFKPSHEEDEEDSLEQQQPANIQYSPQPQSKSVVVTSADVKSKTPTQRFESKKMSTVVTPSRKRINTTSSKDSEVDKTTARNDYRASKSINCVVPPKEDGLTVDPFVSRPKIPRGEGESDACTVKPIEEPHHVVMDKHHAKEPVKIISPEEKIHRSQIANDASSLETTTTASTMLCAVDDNRTPSPFKRVNKLANSFEVERVLETPEKTKSMQVDITKIGCDVEEVPLRDEDSSYEKSYASKATPNTKKRKHRKSIRMPSRDTRKTKQQVKGDKVILSVIKSQIENDSNGLYVLDDVNETCIITSFKVYKYHKLHIHFKGANITKIDAHLQLNYWLATGEAWYTSTMEKIICEGLFSKYNKLSQVPQLLSYVAKKLSTWHPFIHDIYKTFKANLGRVELTSYRMSYRFLIREQKFSSFFLHVDFDTSADQAQPKYQLEHHAFSFVLDEVKMRILDNVSKTAMQKDERPIMRTCSVIRQLCEDVETGVETIDVPTSNTPTLYSIQVT